MIKDAINSVFYLWHFLMLIFFNSLNFLFEIKNSKLKKSKTIKEVIAYDRKN